MNMLIPVLIVFIAGLGGLFIIQMSKHRAQTRSNQPGQEDILKPEQVDEITSTWNLLNK
jgi:flagellar basal body-associated protein FliL